MFTQLQAEKTRSVEEYMDGVKWLFFDIGSTLVDETKVYDDIFQKIAVAGGVSVEEVKTRAIGFYKQNKRGHREVIRLLGVDYPEWSPLYEELYPDTMECLRILKKKYKLGIIANQIPGAEKRLEEMGIRRYFDVIVSSAEEGVAKPDPRIFNIALIRASCTPEQAVMCSPIRSGRCIYMKQTRKPLLPRLRVMNLYPWINWGTLPCRQP